MNNVTNLVVLTPVFVGFLMRYLMSRRVKFEEAKYGFSNILDVQTFSYPKQSVNIIFVLGVIVPLVIILLPDSVVLDVRILFNLFAFFSSLILLFSWAYLRSYKITVNQKSIEYGAFKIKRIDLSAVTGIKYHSVNNGINLKLFSGNKRIANFEGGISGFDEFAKCVRSRLPDSVHVETVGRAAF